MSSWSDRDLMNVCSSRDWWQVQTLVWVMALHFHASRLLKCFIKVKPKPRDLKVLFGIGKYSNFIVLDEGRISKDSHMSTIICCLFFCEGSCLTRILVSDYRQQTISWLMVEKHGAEIICNRYSQKGTDIQNSIALNWVRISSYSLGCLNTILHLVCGGF